MGERRRAPAAAELTIEHMDRTSMPTVSGFGSSTRSCGQGEAPSLSTPTRAAVTPPLHLASADVGEQQGEAEEGEREAEAGEREEGGGGAEEEEARRRGAVVNCFVLIRIMQALAGTSASAGRITICNCFAQPLARGHRTF